MQEIIILISLLHNNACFFCFWDISYLDVMHW